MTRIQTTLAFEVTDEELMPNFAPAVILCKMMKPPSVLLLLLCVIIAASLSTVSDLELWDITV